MTSCLRVVGAANFKQKSKGNQQVQERSIKVHVYGVAVYSSSGSCFNVEVKDILSRSPCIRDRHDPHDQVEDHQRHPW